MSRYETFVIRVWIDKAAEVDHGEIHHALSGSARRFIRMKDAIEFMDHYIRAKSSPLRAVKEDETAR
jgi:hypothetical protein